MEKKYIYPKLPSIHHFIIRFRGSGLANCLFIYARAVLLSKKHNIAILNPSWIQFNIGPYLRREKDKRHYNGLFKPFGKANFLKHWLLLSQKKNSEDISPDSFKKGIIYVEGLKNYFEDIRFNSETVKNHLLSIVNEKDIQAYNKQTEEFIAVHVRLGDYSLDARTNLDWFIDKIKFIQSNISKEITFYIFSDGTENELLELLKIKNCKLVFFGSALADILVLSKAKLILASDSTFSAWGAYLGQVPIVFNKKHFGKILDNENNEIVTHNKEQTETENNLKLLLDKYVIN